MTTMRCIQIAELNAPMKLAQIAIPSPGPYEVRVRVQACGICHTDVLSIVGFPGISYPRVPGHEVAGVIDVVGDHVTAWKPGQRVGVGWFGGACYTCEPCRRGQFINCHNLKHPGVQYDGGYAEYLVCPADALAAIPEELSSVDAAPLLCAGITTFNAIRHSGALPGDTVAILGIGGLGHLAVQYAAKMGFITVAIARGQDKAALAKQLGAHHYIDSEAQNPGEALLKLGGAKVILATVTTGKAITAVSSGLVAQGRVIVVGVGQDPIEVNTGPLVVQCTGIIGHMCGTSIESEDTLRYTVLSGVRPMIETMPLERGPEAFNRMMSGAARFRMVLTME